MDDRQLMIIVFAAITIIALLGTLYKMKQGFGLFNLRIVGIILIIGFMALLAVYNEQAMTACVGIIGAVAGYLFGYRNDDSK